MDSLVPCIEVMQGRITGWNVIWIGRGERVNVIEDCWYQPHTVHGSLIHDCIHCLVTHMYQVSVKLLVH